MLANANTAAINKSGIFYRIVFLKTVLRLNSKAKNGSDNWKMVYH
jgi:hypothetical protein